MLYDSKRSAVHRPRKLLVLVPGYRPDLPCPNAASPGGSSDLASLTEGRELSNRIRNGSLGVSIPEAAFAFHDVSDESS